MEIHSYGIMRGGIHIVHSWIISKFEDNSVLYYNNIRNPHQIEDRLITKNDTRIHNIMNKLTNDLSQYRLLLKSFESKNLDICADNQHKNIKNVLIMRNPYNNLASNIAYNKNNGYCIDVKCDETFIDLWKTYALEFLGKTQHIPNKVTIIYDLFISDETYRKKKAVQLCINPEIDQLNTIYMGGGSSFKSTQTSFLNRYEDYHDNKVMMQIFNDKNIEEYWKQIIEQEQSN